MSAASERAFLVNLIMKYSKTGILKKKVGPNSDALLEESKRMEEKLAELREFMQKDKDKRAQKSKEGTYWRSGGSSKPISNYADLILSYKPKKQAKPTENRKDNFIPTRSLLESSVPNLSQFEKSKEPVKQTVSIPSEILAFLQSCGMEKYCQILIDNGIEELEILLELTEEHLADLKIPLGHRLKILKKIRESHGTPKHTNEQLNESHTHSETAPADLGHGEFNEEESSLMFREALDNFRKSGTTTQQPTNKVHQDYKKVRFTEPVTEAMLPSAKTSLLYQGDWEPQHIAQSHEEATDPKETLTVNEIKKSCWNCYKLFRELEKVGAEEKDFCSKKCRDIYLAESTVDCSCGGKVLRGKGELFKGTWYCSEKCVEESESTDIKINPTTGDPIE